MTHRTLATALQTVAAAALLVPAMAVGSAAAARLEVSAAPLQTWLVTAGLPGRSPHPDVDLSACGNPNDYDQVIYGTEGNDTIVAGNGRQILVGLGGNDILFGGTHDDCLLGGDGADVLLGQNGRDILVGGPGADHLDGGNGKDRLDAGGDQGDTCVSHGAPDELRGCTTRWTPDR